MQSAELSDEEFFRALASSGARVMLIGRRALVALGAPLVTIDYDVWVHFDDVEKLNRAFADLDHEANYAPDEARRRGRYVIENGERVDVMVARSQTAPNGRRLDFDGAWARRQTVEVCPGLHVSVPAIDDLIITKLWASRRKDFEDIEWLERLRGKP